jgi:acylpyruvate hydrolase
VRFATLLTATGPRLHVRAEDGGYVDIGEATGEDRFARFGSFIAAGPAALEAARAVRSREGSEFAPWEFGPAVPAPERILCLGLNYREHALEGGRAVPTWPDTFVRGHQTLIGPYADLVRPALSELFDYEGELGVVIGAGGRYIPASKAIDAIAGFTVLNDASVRDWQRAGTQWTPGKISTAPCPSARRSSPRTRSTSPTWPSPRNSTA